MGPGSKVFNLASKRKGMKKIKSPKIKTPHVPHEFMGAFSPRMKFSISKRNEKRPRMYGTSSVRG